MHATGWQWDGVGEGKGKNKKSVHENTNRSDSIKVLVGENRSVFYWKWQIFGKIDV